MPRGRQRQSAARPLGKNCVMPQVYVDVASALLRHAVRCCAKNLIGKLSVPSKEAVRHMMSKGFQNGISQFEKNIRPSLPISFHSFGNLKKVCKKFFFHVDTIALAAYAEQLLPRGKAAVCCILPRGIVWTYLYEGRFKSKIVLLRSQEIWKHKT